MSQKSLLLTAKQGSFAVGTTPIPKPGPGQVLIKIQSAALNPVEWKIQAYGLFIEKFPSVLGSDIAGTIEAVGEGVTGFAKGDRVLNQGTRGDNNEFSGFQQYALANADVTAKIVSSLSFDQASTVPVGLATAAVGLFNQGKSNSAGLYPPWEENGSGRYAGQPIVIFGGASSVGQYVIQVAKLAGFSPIITTASLTNADYLRGLGATHVLDRKLSAEQLKAQVSSITSASIQIVYDAISEADTQVAAYDLVSSGGTLVLVLANSIPESKRTSDRKIVNVFGNVNAPDNRATGASLYKQLTRLLENGSIKPNRVEVLPNGLQGIVDGLKKLQAGVSNIKLVAHPQETA
ncbi:GroES-like protein [Wolfiporia cocos MD-104 SS10]|uniref:GroES-like protein n=1 Tax=Wolfiporia cocos (strain MD-104) TaxID=742152 RepID=A0A2H3JCM0_WOLCO|nr:GroES-like protein [Wolfiporia cocos MD-104 SS10]